METLIRVVGQYAQWIYALCGFTALYNIYKTWQIRAERRQAVFTLERQKAVDDLYKILFTSLLLLTIMGVTYFVGDVLATAMGIEPPPRSLSENFGATTVGSVQGDIDLLSDNSDENNGQQTTAGEDGNAESGAANTTEDTTLEGDGATDATTNSSADGSAADSNQTESSGDTGTTELTADAAPNGPTDSSAQVNIEANGGVNVAAFPTATQPLPTPTFTYAPPPPPAPPTIVPTAIPAVSSPLCTDTRARINNPGNGSIVSGSFNIVGSATHEQFQFYKIEYAPGASTDQAFVYLAGGNNPINGGVLATVDSGIWPNGTWTIRIVVVDQTGNFPPPCNVTITVSN